GVRWSANGVGYTTDRPAQVFTVAATPPGTEPAYAPAPRPDGGTQEHPSIPVEPVQLTSGTAEHTAPVIPPDGSAALAARTASAGEPRGLRTAPGALPAAGGTARTLLSAADGFRIARAAVAGDGTVAMLASRPAQGRDSVAPDVALWLLEEAGPHRLTDPETLDVASSGADLAVIEI